MTTAKVVFRNVVAGAALLTLMGGVQAQELTGTLKKIQDTG